MEVLVREVSALYGAFSRGEASPLPELAVQYADYAVWQREWLRGEVLEAQIGYWRTRLAGAPPLLEIPVDRPRGVGQGARAGSHGLSLSRELSGGLREFSRREGATLFMTLLAGWQALLGRYAGQEDVVVGSPIAGRTRRETEGLVGFFVNLLALRGEPRGELTWTELVGQVRETTLGAYAHQELPFERLVEELGVERSLAHTPVFQAVFALNRSGAGHGRLELGGLPGEPFGEGAASGKFDLDLVLLDTGSAVDGVLVYREALFGAETMARMAGHLEATLEAMIAEPGRRLSELSLLRGTERAQVLESWNAGAAVSPQGCVHELFARQAALTPHATAVVSGDQTLTYGELDRRSSQLAHLLRRRGVGPDARVAVCLERGPEMVLAMLGILKAGGAYAFLDPEYPAARLALLLAGLAAPVALSQASLRGRLPAEAEVLCLDAERERIAREPETPPEVDVTPEHLCYVIHTSGSTGLPKGAEVPHRAVPGFFWDVDYARFDADTVLLQHSSTSWDALTLELWPALLKGGRCVLYPGRSLDPEGLAREVERHGVTTLWLTSALFNLVVDTRPEMLAGVRQVMTGGEVVSGPHVRRARERHPELRVVNGYGPSECTVFTSCHVVGEGFAGGEVPIGRPVGDRRAYVLDGWGEPVPPGFPGELYVGGAAVARGYLGRPELTAEKLVPDAFGGGAGGRLYRSGDRVRWLAGGELEYLGRTDQQVKVRGFRIEPGEVEAALLEQEDVREAAVVAREDAPGRKRLVAYVVPARGAEVSGAGLRARLGARLPEYMVPSAYVALERLPLNANGKVDRRALPAPEREGAAYVAPRTAEEEVLAGIWAEVLGLERVGVEEGFFELGGHSLLATQVASRARQAFGVEVPLRALFEAQTVSALAERIGALRSGGSGPVAPPIRRVPRTGPLPLSFAQQRLWLVDRMDPGSSAYNLAYALRMRGALDATALQASIGELVRRHEALRTTFEESGGVPVQRVHPPAPVALLIRSLPEASAERLAREEALRPFDLARGPLLRSTLLRLDDEDHVLLFTLHHVVSDGWSMDVLVREVSVLYGAFSRGEPSPLPELPVQYADYAAWQRAWLSGEALAEQLGYWKSRLEGAPPLLEIPTDRPRTPGRQEHGGSHRFALPAETSRELRALSRREGTTLFMTLLAAWQALLARYAGQEDVVVGTPVAGRTQAETEGLIGFFVNMLALRGELGGDPTWLELLARVRETALGAYAHQHLPFEHLVDELGVGRSLAHSPLFQVAFSLQRTAGRGGGLSLGGVEVEPFEAGEGAAKFDLDLAVSDDGEALEGVLVYRASLFEAETVGRMADHLRAMLAALAEGPGRRVSEAPLLADAERARVLEAWNPPPVEAPRAAVHRLFEEQAVRTPDAVAVVSGAEALTYAQLDSRAGRLARTLLREGVGPERVVGVLVEHSVDAVATLLGILKAGGCALFLDPQHPPARLAHLLRDAGARLVVAQPHLRERLPAGAAAPGVVDPRAEAPADGEDPALPAVAPESAAYIIYTSGSTGQPKGVLVPHGAAAVHLAGIGRTYRLAPVDRVLAFAPQTFDPFLEQSLAPLLAGASVVLRDPALWTPAEFAERVNALGVTVADVTPAYLAQVVGDSSLAAGLKRTLRLVIVGGETLPPALVRAWEEAPGGPVRLVNGYGPTETVVTATVFEATDGDSAGWGAGVPIGRAVGGRATYVLDAHGEPAPVGVPGELFVGGAALARGYVGRPELTADRFVPDGFGSVPGARLYRTGDRARWRADGVLEFLGRVDHQVKVRGIRIEPGEVEAALRERAGVREAVVVVREEGTGEKRLVACVVAEDGAEVSAAGLRAHLRARLPEHLVPGAYEVLERLPLTASGKVDRRALSVPRAAERAEYAAPRTEMEELLCQLWLDLLGSARGTRNERVGVHDNFFELGGNSLLATQVVARIRQELGIEVPVKALFESPTVEAFATAVEDLLIVGLDSDELEERLSSLELVGDQDER
jgi:amino acid adenylation domain-containing protein